MSSCLEGAYGKDFAQPIQFHAISHREEPVWQIRQEHSSQQSLPLYACLDVGKCVCWAGWAELYDVFFL